jgi:hypothetical protein
VNKGGIEEGLKQVRVLGDGSSGETSGKTRSGRSRNHSSRHNATTDIGPTQRSLEAEAAIRSIAEREDECIRLQLKAVERELDMERVKVKDAEKEKGRLEKIARAERKRRDEREREYWEYGERIH